MHSPAEQKSYLHSEYLVLHPGCGPSRLVYLQSKLVDAFQKLVVHKFPSSHVAGHFFPKHVPFAHP